MNTLPWSLPNELHNQLQKRWDRGELLACQVTGESPCPLGLNLKTPTSLEMTEQFDQVRAWITDLRAMPHCRILMREFKHRVFGNNVVPDQLWVETLDTAVA